MYVTILYYIYYLSIPVLHAEVASSTQTSVTSITSDLNSKYLKKYTYMCTHHLAHII